MNKLYAVVLWSDEPDNYSAVKISKIKLDEKTITDENQLIDQIFEIRLDKAGSELYTGKILHVGSRARMSRVAAELASDAADLSFQEKEDLEPKMRSSRMTKRAKAKELLGMDNAKRKRNSQGANEEDPSPNPDFHDSEGNGTEEGVVDLPEDLEPGAEVLMVPPAIETEEMEPQTIPDEKDKLIQKLRLKLRKRDKKISALKDDLARFQPREDETVDIGGGYLVSKELLMELKAEYRHNPGVFLRKLMEKSELFSLEEIANSSLTGQKHHDGSQRPRLDHKKFTVCKDFAVKKCKLKDNTIKMLQFRKSISNICTDARKRLRKNNNPLGV